MADAPNLETMSIDELWELHQKLGEVLEVKINAEKQELDRRLISLHPLENRTRARRPHPPVVPKLANPDAPED
jgi:DNA-binding protein H-NS